MKPFWRAIVIGSPGAGKVSLPGRCDAVFLLDYPTEVCLAGAAARVGTVREDLPWVEDEFDGEFRQWIEGFPEKQLPEISMLGV